MDAVVDVALVYGDAEPPAGFTKMKKNLAKGGSQPVYLAFKSAPQTNEVRPLGTLMILFDKNSKPEKGASWFVVVAQPTTTSRRQHLLTLAICSCVRVRVCPFRRVDHAGRQHQPVRQ